MSMMMLLTSFRSSISTLLTRLLRVVCMSDDVIRVRLSILDSHNEFTKRHNNVLKGKIDKGNVRETTSSPPDRTKGQVIIHVFTLW